VSQISIHDVVERPEEYTLADTLLFQVAEIVADHTNNSCWYLYVPAGLGVGYLYDHLRVHVEHPAQSAFARVLLREDCN
jgi:hypothetical protein